MGGSGRRVKEEEVEGGGRSEMFQDKSDAGGNYTMYIIVHAVQYYALFNSKNFLVYT